MTTALALAPKASTRLFLGVERSVCGRAWRDRLDERATARALAIAQRHNVPELLARILAGRGVEVDEVEAFLDPTVRRLMPDPHTVTAMEQAAQRHRRRHGARRAGRDLRRLRRRWRDRLGACWRASCGMGGIEPIVHIPDRIFEGYGPNVEAIRSLAERGAKLLVTVDCGTTSIEPLAEARRLGLDVIVIDHHQADERLPDAIVVNPNRLDDLSGLGHLAAVGLVFLTVVAVNRVLRTRGFWTETRPEPDLLGLLDIVALGTVADVVPLKGLNRAFVAKGLLGAAPPRQRGPDRADGRGAAVRSARAVSSRLPARAAHQRRRPHRPRRSRLAAAAHRRSGRGRAHRRRARPPQRRAPGDGGGDAGGGAKPKRRPRSASRRRARWW